MKIYLASSWRNKDAVLVMAKKLQLEGHVVDAFCDEIRRISFNWDELLDIMTREGNDLATLDAKEMMGHWRVRAAFEEDKKYLDWADAIIMLMPCGRSAHLEAGYAAGSGKLLYIVGGFEPGEFETMYGFATGMYYYKEIYELLAELKQQDRTLYDGQ